MKKIKALAYLLVLALVLSGITLTGYAADGIGFDVSVDTGDQTVVTVSLTGYNEQAPGIRGLQVDITGLEHDALRVAAYTSLIEDADALSNTASYNEKYHRVRLLYALMEGTLTAPCEDVLRLVLEVDPDQAGFLELPVQVLIQLEDGQKLTLDSSCTISLGEHETDTVEEDSSIDPLLVILPILAAVAVCALWLIKRNKTKNRRT